MTSHPNRVTVFYIGGSARSGTGILGRILSRLSGATHGGELRRLWSRGPRPERGCDCGRSHEDCPVWSKLLVPGASYLQPSIPDLRELQRAAAPETHAWWHALKILRRRSPPAPESVEARYVALYSDLYQAFARVTGSTVVIDNSKNPADAALLAYASRVTAICVQVVRDPRAVLYSIRKRSAPDNPSSFRPLETVRFAVYWTLRHFTFDAIRRRYGEHRSFLVIYEDLMTDPNMAIRTACRLLGVPDPEIDLKPEVPLAMPEVHGPDGSRVARFKPTEVVVRKDDRWRDALHPIDRILVTLLTFPLLLRFGYSIRTKRANLERVL